MAEDVVNMDSSEEESEEEKTNSWTWLHRESSKLKVPKANSETILDSKVDKTFPKVKANSLHPYFGSNILNIDMKFLLCRFKFKTFQIINKLDNRSLLY